MDRADIVHLLRDEPWEDVRAKAEKALLAEKGSHVFARGLIEFSNVCRRNCLYCGLRRQNRLVPRYAMSAEEIMVSANAAAQAGMDTIVLQSGERGVDPGWLAEIIIEIRHTLKLPVTLSVGEHDAKDYELWRKAGAVRYLLRHETSDPALYARLHPGYSLEDRVDCLKILGSLGYETGGGFMIGLPGQSLETIADDILLSRDLGVAMCGVGPFIAQEDTPFASEPSGSPELALRALAVLRLALPKTNLPATTALATLDPMAGQTRGLKAGANVLMPSFTPPQFSKSYRIYNHKNRVAVESAIHAIEAAGRTHSIRKKQDGCSSPKDYEADCQI